MMELTGLEFPCEFPIKIMGAASNAFEMAAIAIVNKHLETPVSEGAIKTRQSRGGRYLAITITFTATSQAQLDKIYTELSAHDLVEMVL